MNRTAPTCPKKIVHQGVKRSEERISEHQVAKHRRKEHPLDAQVWRKLEMLIRKGRLDSINV